MGLVLIRNELQMERNCVIFPLANKLSVIISRTLVNLENGEADETVNYRPEFIAIRNWFNLSLKDSLI